MLNRRSLIGAGFGVASGGFRTAGSRALGEVVGSSQFGLSGVDKAVMALYRKDGIRREREDVRRFSGVYAARVGSMRSWSPAFRAQVLMEDELARCERNRSMEEWISAQIEKIRGDAS